MSIESVMPSNHLILCPTLLLLPSIFPSIRVSSSEMALCIKCWKYWSFRFSISPSNDYSGLIYFRLTGLMSLLSEALSRVFSSTTVQRRQFFRAQPSLWSISHIRTWLGKTIALTIWTFVGKVMSLLFTTLSRLVIAFLPGTSSVQFSCSVMSISLQPHEPQHARPPCPSPTPGVYPHPCPLIGDAIQPSHPLSSPSPPAPSIRVFSNESAPRIRWPTYWNFSFNISPSNERPELISFRMDWLDLLAVQGTLKSLFQHHSSKTLILQCSAFFVVQLSHPYMTTGKTIALTRQTFVGKVMSLRFNMLSRLVITFLPRSKCLLISWLQSPSAVILEPLKINPDTVSTVSPSFYHEVMGPDAMILVFWMLSFKPTFSLLFHFHQEALCLSSLSALGWCHLHILLIFLQAILIPAWASSSLASLMMYSAYKLNNHGDNIQPFFLS